MKYGLRLKMIKLCILNTLERKVLKVYGAVTEQGIWKIETTSNPELIWQQILIGEDLKGLGM